MTPCTCNNFYCPRCRAQRLAQRDPHLTTSALARMAGCDLSDAAEALRLAHAWRGDGWVSDDEIRRRQAERRAA